MTDSDNEPPQLSAETFLALQEFYQEQEKRESDLLSGAAVQEDWQLSQFWYNEQTTKDLVKIVLNAVDRSGKIALISCPTLYNKLKENVDEVHLYEFDQRFASFGADFHAYDYKNPLINIPRDRANYYDLVIADPPFLSDDCLTKTAITIRFLTKSKILLCTGAVMGNLAKRLLDLNETTFKPQHQNNLGNEFSCFSNFEIGMFDR